MQNYIYSIQKRTADFIAIGSVAIIIVSFILKILILKQSFIEFVLYYIPVLIIGSLCFLSKLKFTKIFQALQISLIFITAILTIFSYTDIRNITGEAIFIFFIYLSIQYGFLRKFFLLKILSLLVTIIAIKGFKFFIFTEKIPSSDDILFFLSQYILLSFMFSLFAINQQEELNNYIQQKTITENKFFKNEVYIDLGKIVRDFIHDLKAVGGTWLTLKIAKERLAEITVNDSNSQDKINIVLEQIGRSVEMLRSVYNKQDTINSIAYSKYKVQTEIINICDMMNHITNYLIYTYYLRNIDVVKDYPSELLICAIPFEIVQAIENITKNAIEAMQDSVKKLLNIKIEREDENVKIIISDTGGGITFSENDGLVNLEIFSTGQTTKPEGTGWGVVSAINFIKKNHGDIQFYSIKNHGTSVIIKFKNYREIKEGK